MPNFYNIGAQRGRTVGQGLMGIGQAVSGGIETKRRTEEKKKADQFTKTLSLVNLYTKMGDDLAPEDRMKLYTGALLPMLAKAGGLPEGVKQKDVSDFITTLSVRSKKAMKEFREHNDKLLDLVNEGKWSEADKALTEMISKYGRLPGVKPILEHSKTMLKEGKEYSREQKEKKGEREEEVGDKIAGWIAEGKVKDISETGLMAGEKGTTFEYGGKQLFVPEEEEKPKTEQLTIYGPGGKTKRVAVEKGETYAPPEGWSLKAPGKAKGPEVKESTALKQMEAIKKGIDRYETTGGLTGEFLMAIRSYDPAFAQEIQEKPHDEAIDFMKKRYNYLFDNFVSKKNKSRYGLERFEEKGPAATSNITHKFVPGKGLVPVK